MEMRWAEHVEGADQKYIHRVGGGKKRNKRDRLEDLGVDGRILLKWIQRI
jgi:hypothetical protein